MPLLLGLMALIPLIGAQFGYGNQIEQFSIVERLRDPAFARGDPYVDAASAFGPRIYYAHLLAGLSAWLPLHWVVHSASVLCNLLLAWTTYAAARRFLAAPALAGVFAALLAVTNGGITLGLAGFLRFDSFQPASIATPLSLLGIYLLLSGRPLLALAAFVPAGLMHPLIAVELAALSYFAAFVAVIIRRDRDALRSVSILGLSGVLFGLAVFVAWALPASAPAGDALSPLEFFAILARFRAPHHYLGLEFSAKAWILAALFLAGAVGTVLALARRQGLSAEAVGLAAAAALVVGFCLLSLYFVDIAESRLWTTAQVFRMTLLLKWVAFLCLAALLADCAARHAPSAVVAAVGIGIAIGDAQGAILIPALAFLIFFCPAGQVSGFRPPRAVWAGSSAVLVLLAVLALQRYGDTQQAFRVLLGLAATGLVFAPAAMPAARGIAAAALVLGVLALAFVQRHDGLFGVAGLDSDLVWADETSDKFDIALRARGIGPEDAIWIVPPDFESFRLVARRAVVVDFTSIPYGDGPMRSWMERIRDVYGEVEGTGFRALGQMKKAYADGIDLRRIAREYGAGFAILNRETPWAGPVLAENDSYKAVAIPPPGG